MPDAPDKCKFKCDMQMTSGSEIALDGGAKTEGNWGGKHLFIYLKAFFLKHNYTLWQDSELNARYAQ